MTIRPLTNIIGDVRVTAGLYWDAFIAEHGVAEYIRVRYIEALARR
jgi:hypothetical protein